MDFRELMQKANANRKSRKYAEAIPFYSEMYHNHIDQCNEWDIWGYAFCLYKLKRYNESLAICEEFYKKNKSFGYINHLYAWNLYYVKIKNSSEDKNAITTLGEFILDLIGNDKKYSPYYLVIFEILDKLNDYGNKYLKSMEYWLKKLDADNLSDKAYSFTDKRGKNKEIASDLEKYYMYKIQINFFLGNYSDCIHTIEEAFRKLNNLHYSNRLWFERRMAQSMAKLNQTDEAIKKYKKIIQTKQDWFLLGELGEIYLQTKDYDNAKKYLLKAALTRGDFDKKVNLFKTIAYLYDEINNREFYEKLMKTVYAIRNKNNWKIPAYLEQFVTHKDYNTIKNETLSLLQDEYETIEPYHKGTISKILPHGKAGFIRSNNNKFYYFRMNDVKNKDKISENANVKYHLVEGFDKKKNKKTINATDVVVI